MSENQIHARLRRIERLTSQIGGGSDPITPEEAKDLEDCCEEIQAIHDALLDTPDLASLPGLISALTGITETAALLSKLSGALTWWTFMRTLTAINTILNIANGAQNRQVLSEIARLERKLEIPTFAGLSTSVQVINATVSQMEKADLIWYHRDGGDDPSSDYWYPVLVDAPSGSSIRISVEWSEAVLERQVGEAIAAELNAFDFNAIDYRNFQAVTSYAPGIASMPVSKWVNWSQSFSDWQQRVRPLSNALGASASSTAMQDEFAQDYRLFDEINIDAVVGQGSQYTVLTGYSNSRPSFDEDTSKWSSRPSELLVNPNNASEWVLNDSSLFPEGGSSLNLDRAGSGLVTVRPLSDDRWFTKDDRTPVFRAKHDSG